MRKMYGFLFVLLSLCPCVSAQVGPEPVTLVSGQPVEREIAGEQRHTYQISLTTGQFVRVMVEEKGVDVVVTLNAPDGKPIIEGDVANGTYGQESLSHEAAVNETLQVVIRAVAANAPAGTYQVRLEVKPAATARDKQRIAAEGLLAEAIKLSQQGAAALPATLEKAQQALSLWRELADSYWEASTLSRIGRAYSLAKKYDQAIESYNQALAISREIKDPRAEAITLQRLATRYYELRQFEKMIESLKQSLVIHQETGNQVEEDLVLNTLGVQYARLSRYDKSRECFEQALALSRKARNKDWEGSALVGLGIAYGHLNQYEKSVVSHEQALANFRELGNKNGEGIVLTNLGNAYRFLGRYEKALECYEQSLAIIRKSNVRKGEGMALINLGRLYGFLGQTEKALEYFKQALAIGQELREMHTVALALNNLGHTYRNLQEFEKAIENYDQSLAIYREYKDRKGEGAELYGLGLVYMNLNQYEKALEYYEQALTISREIGGTGGSALLSIGHVWRLRGRTELAITYHGQVLQIARKLKLIDSEAAALKELMLDWKARNQVTIATYFGKQSVNAYQEIRSSIRALDTDLQQSFLKTKEETYRELADLLIAQGRLPEAEQVIGMLKEEEFFEYIRRDVNNSPKGERAALTPEEAAIDKRYREIADKLTEIGTQRAALLEKQLRTPEEEKLLTQLEADLAVAGQVFEKFLDGLSSEFAKHRDGQNRLFQMREAQGFMSDLRELGKGTVALYTLVGATKFRVILITPAVRKAYEYPIDEAAFNRKVLALRAALRNPAEDARPAAQELYQIVFGPLAKDLRAMRAETLMWSLDGVLRYVPIAALYDGEQYLVERYRNVVFTPASQSRLKDEPRTRWQALGLGVTRGLGDKLAPLPAVAEEMRSIIKDANDPGSQGVLPGTIKLNEQFTQESMLVGLRQRPPVVHVASHFEFKPGNEVDSALLLGDGKLLSLAQIKALPNVFDGVELLTLSACDTATGGSGATGKEVEGFAVQAQRQGAKAVVASLWPVADRTTRLLMEAFYRGREEQRLSKGEALRQAQIKLLRGDLTRKSAADALATRGSQEPVKTGTARAEIKRPYAHPYYWAPFIMIGNWK